MLVKIVISVTLVASLLLSSCYPELSVQQYDRLKEDLKTLDTERQQLRAQVVSLQEEIEAHKVKNAETLAYVRFLEKLEATQSSEKLLSGQFDVASLFKAKDELTVLADKLADNEVSYFLGLLAPGNDSQTVGAYYKIIEYSLKKIKQKLE